MSQIAIEHEEVDGRGAFFVAREGVRLAVLSYTRVDASTVIIDHTEVNQALRGLGVARRLLDRTVAWARETKTQVMATCPYAKGEFERDASIQDVMKR